MYICIVDWHALTAEYKDTSGLRDYVFQAAIDILAVGLDPNTCAEVRQLTVFDGPAPIRYLNELEYVEGRIFANVWPSNFIAVIAPDTGRVAAWIDLRGLFRPAGPNASEQVLNGIAYDPSSRRLFVTGKLWPRIFEIELLGPRSH